MYFITQVRCYNDFSILYFVLNLAQHSYNRSLPLSPSLSCKFPFVRNFSSNMNFNFSSFFLLRQTTTKNKWKICPKNVWLKTLLVDWSWFSKILCLWIEKKVKLSLFILFTHAHTYNKGHGFLFDAL